MNTKVLRNAVATLTALRLGVAQEEEDVFEALEVALEAAVSGHLSIEHLCDLLDPSLMRLLYESEPWVLLDAGKVLPEQLFSRRIERKLLVRGDVHHLLAAWETWPEHRARNIFVYLLGRVGADALEKRYPSEDTIQFLLASNNPRALYTAGLVLVMERGDRLARALARTGSAVYIRNAIVHWPERCYDECLADSLVELAASAANPPSLEAYLKDGTVACEAHRAFFLLYESLGRIPRARLTRKMFDLLQSAGEKEVLLQLPLFFPLEYTRPILEMFLRSGSAKDVAYLAERVPEEVFNIFGEQLIRTFLERATPREIETALVIWPHKRIHRLKELRLRQEGGI